VIGRFLLTEVKFFIREILEQFVLNGLGFRLDLWRRLAEVTGREGLELLTLQELLTEAAAGLRSVRTAIVLDWNIEADGDFVDEGVLAHNLIEISEHSLYMGEAVHLDLEAD
jgi:hypothetical protein